MMPKLVELRLLPGAIPLSVLLWGLVVVAAALALRGAHRRASDQVVVAGTVALVAAAAAVRWSDAAVGPASVPIMAYGAAAVTGAALTWGVGRALGTVPSAVFDVRWAQAVVAALAAARVGYLAASAPARPGLAGALAVGDGGLSWPAGVVGFVATLVVLDRRRPRLRRQLLAALIPPLCLALMVLATGRHLAGSGHGIPLPAGAPSWLQLAGTYPRWSGDLAGLGAPAWRAQVIAGSIGPGAVGSLPVHPLALYDAVVCLGLAVTTAVLFQRARFEALLHVFVLGQSAWWILRETVAGDPGRGLLGPRLPVGVAVVAAFVALAAASMVLGLRGKRPASAASWAARVAAPSALLVVGGAAVAWAHEPSVLGLPWWLGLAFGGALLLETPLGVKAVGTGAR